jgi:hypothetical protein
VLTYFVAHEAHHRQIVLVARALGATPSNDLAAFGSGRSVRGGGETALSRIQTRACGARMMPCRTISKALCVVRVSLPRPS